MSEFTEFRVDPELARAETPPGRAYGDPALFEALRERALAPSWHWLDAEPPEPEAAAPLELCPGALDEPLVLARAGDGELALCSNVCTHRAHPVCLQAGPARELRCRYHGRAFGLDGRLRRAPGFEGALGFPRPEDDLPRLPLERLGPLLFTSLAPSSSFEEWIAPARERCSWFPWSDLRRDPAADRSFVVQAHWALYVENYLEGFHIPWVHPELRATLTLASYRVEVLPRGVLQVGVAAEGVPALEPPPDGPEGGARLAGVYLWLFPNLMLNLYPFGLSLNRVVPLAADRTRIDYRRWILDGALVGHGAGGALDLVEQQDDEVVEGVARGVRSRLYRRGRYAPAHEAGTHHFHRLLSEALDGA